MKLNLTERIVALNLLPQEGNFLTLRTIREHQMKISPSEAEIKKYGVTEQDGKIFFANPQLAEKETVDIEIGEIVTNIITEALETLNKEEKLKPVQMSLYEKFVIKKN